MDITFMRKGRVLQHSSADLHRADTVSLYFDMQKRDTRGETVTQCSTRHPIYCPVAACAQVVRSMLADGCAETDEVFWYKDTKGKRKQLSDTFALKTLRTFISTIENRWNIRPDEVGLHSWRSSAAMAMYLSKTPTFVIMLLGRWSSDAFLRYIRPQADNFSDGVSRGMIQSQAFIHVPDANRRDEDPRTSNPLLNRAKSGNGLRSFCTQDDAFHVWA
jgi:hypothetical protein